MNPFLQDCFKRHQNLVDYVNKELGKDEPAKPEEKSWWQKLFGQ